MKCLKFVLSFTVILLAMQLNAQVTGMWYGVVNLNGTKLRTNIEIVQQEDSTFSGVLFSPDQTDKPMPGALVRFVEHNDSLYLTHDRLKLTYTAVVDEQQQVITGRMRQGPYDVPLELTRNPIEDIATVRPQTPENPSGFIQEVMIDNSHSGHKIGATITMPSKNGSFPFVVFASGSGPQDRDATMLEHKFFLVLAEHLVKAGIGSVRFDDRGTGKSEGSFAGTNLEGFASDVKAVYEYTRQLEQANKVGLLGHSEGGMHIMMVNKEVKDADFMIFMACAGVKGEKLYLKQHEDIALESGSSEKEAAENVEMFRTIIKIGREEKDPTGKLQAYVGECYDQLTPEEKEQIGNKMQYQAAILSFCNNEWFRDFMDFDPNDYWKSMKSTPVLAINGTKDLQVNAEQNLSGFKTGLEKVKNKTHQIKKFEGLNHLFQQCETGMVSEYGEIETTIEPQVLTYISVWINQR